MRSLNKYWWVALTSARSNIAYLGEVVGRLIFLAVILYIFLRLWKVTYGETGASSLGGLSLSQMLWYLTITESLTMSVPRVAPQVDEDVRTGSLAMQLVRPMNYGFYRMATTLGERTVRFLINFVVGSLITFMLVGPLDSWSSGSILLLVALPLAFVLDFLGNFWVGLGAFWLEDTTGLLLIYSRATMLVGGMLIPLELYPTAVQPLLKWLPFSSMIYGPAKLFVDPHWSLLIDLLVRQSAGALVMGAGVYLTYRVALRRVFVNGG